MTAPEQTVIVYWADAPPAGLHHVADMHLRDELRAVDWIWWRSRWCCVARELLVVEPDILGRIDRLAAEGKAGIVFERMGAD